MDKIKILLKSRIDWTSRLIGTDMMYVVKNGFWVNANFVLSIFLGLTSSVLFANFVSKNVYGTYQFILALAGTIAVVVPNNMSSAVLRSVAQGHEGDFIAATKFQIRWGTIGSVIALGASVWYALNQNLNLSWSLVVIALFMPATYALNTWSAYLQGKKDYQRFFYYSAFSSLISYGGVFVVIFIKPEYFWLALANIVAAFIANLCLYFFTLRQVPPNKKTDPETIRYGAHLSLMGIPQGLAGQLDALLIFHFLGPTALAIYSFATLLPEKLTGGLKFISSIASPKFAEKSEADVSSFFKKKIWILIGFLAVIIGCYVIIVPQVFYWLFPKYLQSIPFTRLYALSFLSVAASVGQTAMVSQRKLRELYVLSLTAPFLKVALLVGLGYFFGVWGIIWAQLIVILYQIGFPIFSFRK